jgi:DUF4097 and DUF4098 domain-containing protein YvlB
MRHGRAWSLVTLVAALGVSLSTVTRAGAAEGSFERTLKVTGAVELEVSTGSGNIGVRTGDSMSVRVHGIIKAHNHWGDESRAEEKVRRLESNPPIEQNGNVIKIGRIEDADLRRNVSISYELEVPAETQLRCETGSGGVAVDGVHGPVKASTGSGSLRVSNIGDEVRANTGSGDVHLDGIKSSANAHTGSGSIRAFGIGGSFVGHTGSGDIELEQTAAGHVEVETGSGGIELRGVRGPLRAHAGSGNIMARGEHGGDWDLQTGSGTVNVRLPSQAAFDLYAHSSSGHITVDHHPMTVQGTIGRSEVRGKVRGGGFRLDVRTGSGNIRVE